MFIERGQCYLRNHDVDDGMFYAKIQIRIMASLNILGNHTPFGQNIINIELSTEDHYLFFHMFLNQIYSAKDEFGKYQETIEELQPVMGKYTAKKLLGCGGSIDVLHLKWSDCPVGDLNRSKDKEGFPARAFEVITGNEGYSQYCSSAIWGH